MTGKKRLNYAEQLSNFDNLHLLISLIKKDNDCKIMKRKKTQNELNEIAIALGGAPKIEEEDEELDYDDFEEEIEQINLLR